MFLDYIHNLRGLAILFIVSGHSIRFFSWETNPEIEKMAKMMMLNGTVMFVFIAGFLFQHLSKKYSYGKYLINKLKNVIVPYIFVSTPMILYHVFIQKQGHWSCPGLEKKPYIIQMGWFFLTGQHLAPLWFIPMITVFYLMFPLFIKIDRHSVSYYILIPCTILISILVHRAPGETNLLHMIAHLISVYIFGMYISRYKENIFEFIEKYINALILLLLSIILIEFYFYKNVGIIYVENIFRHEKELININYFQKIILSLIFMYFFRKYNDTLIRIGVSRVLKKFAAFSFGIYFVHYYFIEALLRTRRLFQYSVNGNLLYLFIFVIFICLLSFFTVLITKLIFKEKSRYLIGC